MSVDNKLSVSASWESDNLGSVGRFVDFLLVGNVDVPAGMVGLAPKWVRLVPKGDKSGAFSDQISVHLMH